MKSKLSIAFATLFVLSMTACSSYSAKTVETQVPEMSTAMPEEISTKTSSPDAAPEAVKAKRVGDKKKSAAKK
jgi:uncharacterized lipoprotein YbaY